MARWHDLPERYGKYKSVHARFMRWARGGVWERLFDDLCGGQEEPVPDAGLNYRSSAPAGGRRPQKGGSADKAMGVPEVD